MKKAKILVVEDDDALREAISDTLELADYEVLVCGHGEAALTELHVHSDIALVISDVQMSPVDGLSLLKSIRGSHFDLPVILMTAYGSVPKAVSALHLGASDYLAKPFEVHELLQKVENLIADSPEHSDAFIASDPVMEELVGVAQRVAASEATVMISGPSGAGKEVVARFIHQYSDRSDKPFIAINCAAIPENMLEAVLFGYEKGAFTGAYKSMPGKFELAQGGTLLLDEISEMDLGLQAKLLRVLQEKEVERLGGRTLISLDVRILATTNRALKDEVAAGRFREDLFYRLNVFPLKLPPLNARRSDIPLLAKHFIAKYHKGPEPERTLSTEAELRLLDYSWPGNVRELDNVVQRALILANGRQIQGADILFEELESDAIEADDETKQDSASMLNSNLRSREHEMIVDALRAANGSRKTAAEALGISARTLRYKLSRMREDGIAIPGQSGALA